MDAEFAVPDAVLAAYGLDDAHVDVLTGGRTNRTMRVRAGRDLVLQQMLGSAHKDLLGIMENLVRVTSHLEWRRRVERQGDSWYPHLMPTNQGKPFLMTAEGDVWRSFMYRKGQILRSSQPLSTLSSAAALYGRFAAETADLGGPPLIETAPGFHDLDLVYSNLQSDFEASSIDRRRDLEPMFNHLDAVKKQLDDRCVDDGVQWAPDRVVHNDTKLSNVLFDRDHGRATAVLDLDLAMMGPLVARRWRPDSQRIVACTGRYRVTSVLGGIVRRGGGRVRRGSGRDRDRRRDRKLRRRWPPTEF